MPPPTPDHIRQAIITDITTGQLSRNAIARKHNVAQSTVTRIAEAEGLADAFDRTQTKNATEALRSDNKAKRAELQELFLRRGKEALLAMDQPFVVFKIGGKDNIYTEHDVPIPPTVDQRNLMIIAATALDKALAIERFDTDDQDLPAVDAWVRVQLYGDTSKVPMPEPIVHDDPDQDDQ